MSVLSENRDVLLKEIRVARVLPTLRKHLPEFLISDIENQLTIRKYVLGANFPGVIQVTVKC